MSTKEGAAAKSGGGAWWRRRSLKLRLAVWFALIASVLLLALLPFVYTLIERRLKADLDLQMGIDWVLIEAHLEADGAGLVRWREDSPSSLGSGGYAESWFDVWAEGRLLMEHWPAHGAKVSDPPRSTAAGSGFHTLFVNGDRKTRALEKPARISGREVDLRVFRDLSGIQRTLRQILLGLAVGLPVAVALAATGGYHMAGRALKPIVEMTEQARRITSESLGRRLPNPNPYDELGQLATVFNETLQRIENSFEALRRFTADASHELRTPLTALRTVGEIALREDGDAESLRETVGSMLEEAERLHHLADTLLMLARAESGRAPLRREPVALPAVVKEVCESLEVLASEKRQRIALELAPEFVAEADPVLLRQAVMNLLHNAIRYSHGGTTIRVACFSEGDEAFVEVADEGPGIAPEHQKLVFERFYRVDKARTRARGGVGLGLALAKLSIEPFGGTIELESDPGRGSLFRIRLPHRSTSMPPDSEQI